MLSMDEKKITAVDVVMQEAKDADMGALVRMVPDIYEFIHDPVQLEQAKSALLIRADEIGDRKMIQPIMTAIEREGRNKKRLANIQYNRDAAAAFLDLDKNGLPCDTISNFFGIMTCDPHYKNIKFNLVTNQPEIIRTGADGEEILENWTDTDDAASQNYIEEEYKIYSPQKHTAALRMLFRQREYACKST